MGSIPMVHRLCKTCGMSATMVVTRTGERAWRDHLDTHGPEADEDVWTWHVERLPEPDA
jgi:hypothetical protein